MTQDQQQQWAKFMEDAVTKTEQASISSIPSFIINGHHGETKRPPLYGRTAGNHLPPSEQ
ncbi:hypothetical protein OH492_20685 [Vibrio chagasii]|nr:hypothetical protein [Vibrio chagasii]